MPEKCPSCDGTLKYSNGVYLTNPPINHATCDECKTVYDYTAETGELKVCGGGRKELKSRGGIYLPESARVKW